MENIQEKINNLQKNMLTRLQTHHNQMILSTGINDQEPVNEPISVNVITGKPKPQNEVLDNGKTISIVNDEKFEFDPSIVLYIIINGNIPNIDTIITSCHDVRSMECYNCNTLTRLPVSPQLYSLKIINCTITGMYFQHWDHLKCAIFKSCNKLIDYAFTKQWKSLKYLEIDNCENVSRYHIHISVPYFDELIFK